MSDRPKLLDLFSGGGGAAMGYYRAGFDVVGVDIEPQPRYPFTFIQADAMTYPLDGYDVIHASPPCQGYSASRHQAAERAHKHPMLIEPTRRRLMASGLPWVIENVEGSPLNNPLVLCGTMFGLHVYRHRLFESGELLMMPRAACRHSRRMPADFVSVYGNTCYTPREPGKWGGRGKREHRSLSVARAAMGIDWMDFEGLSQAIPPAYTEWIGRQLMAVVEYNRSRQGTREPLAV